MNIQYNSASTGKKPALKPQVRPRTAQVKPLAPQITQILNAVAAAKPTTPMTNFAIPQTPNQAGGSKKSANPKKKSDPVSRYQSMQNQW
jgi:hypothetical protein